MGESTFSMNYEFAVLGIGVNLQLSGGESFSMIEDEPVEKEAVEKKKNFFEEFVENIKPSGLVVSAIFGAIGVIATVVAAPLTGAAPVIGEPLQSERQWQPRLQNYIPMERRL